MTRLPLSLPGKSLGASARHPPPGNPPDFRSTFPGQPLQWNFVLAALIGFVAAAGLLLWGLTFVGPVPLVVMTVAMGVLVTIRAVRRNDPLRHRRALAGKCEECGYDLRASHDRCPECGAALPEELERRRRIAGELRAIRQPSRPAPPKADDALPAQAPPRT